MQLIKNCLSFLGMKTSIKLCFRALPLTFAFLTVCLLLTSCSQGESSSASSAAPAVPKVVVTTVKSEKLASFSRLPAELVPYESVDIYARETGFVKSIRVDRGSNIKQGELIAELEAPELIAQRAQANAAYESAESRLSEARTKLGSDRATFQHMSAAAKVAGVVAANDLDVLEKTTQSEEDNVAALQKSAEAAEENLKAVAQLESYLRITAPFDGQITTRYVHPGTLVGPASGAGAVPIVRLETMDRHRLVVPVPENDVAGVPQGMQVIFTTPIFPGRTFDAPITRISHDVDSKTRTMPVELDVMDPRLELISGTFCEVEWPIRRTYPTLFVPTSSVASNLQRTFVIRVRKNRTEWVDVKTGVSVGDLTEVFGSLDQGDQVAMRATDELRAGTEVSPQLVTQN